MFGKINDLSIGGKLAITFGIVAMILIGVAAVNYVNSEQVKSNFDTIMLNNIPRVDAIHKINEDLLVTRRMEKNVLIDLAQEPRFRQQLAQWPQARQKAEQYVREQGKKDLTTIDEKLKEYEKHFNTMVELLKAGQTEEAKALSFGPMAKIGGEVDELIAGMLMRNSQTMEESKNLAYGALSTSNYTSLAASGLTLVLTVFFGFILTRAIAVPLQGLAAAAEKIADGDLTQEVANLERKDEVGVLNHAFRLMGANLRHLIGEINRGAGHLAEVSRQMSDAACQSGEVSTQVANTISEVANGTTQQAGHAQEVLKMMENTQRRVEDGNKEVEKTVHNAHTSTQVAHEGHGAIRRSIEELKVVAGNVKEATGEIQKLGKRSEEIGGIITTITDISSQTNLLALNAAIEAARAGEQGRGFAVVAEEVRKLAEESKGAAEKITEMVSDIQRETLAVVKSMENNLNAVERQVEMIQQGGDALEEIVSRVEQTETDSRTIQDIFKELRENSEGVLKAIQEISSITQQSAAAAEEVAASAEEQSAAVEEIAASASETTHLASRLQEEIQKFRI